MLTHLQISDFTLIDNLDLELHQGLSTITGETGAGKSVVLDALSLALGGRTDADKVRAGCKRADIHASFDISTLPKAARWLKQNELGHETGEGTQPEFNDCILRRIITAEGRSRAYINGHTATLVQLRQIGEILIDIHSQHAHQSLLKTAHHSKLLDDFGNHQQLLKVLKQAFAQWQNYSEELNRTKNQSDELNARFQLLSYQVEEFNQLALEEGELQSLENEQRVLANTETLQQTCQHVVSICSDDSGIQAQLHQTIQLLAQLSEPPQALQEAESMLRNALIHVEESQSEIERFSDQQESDAARLPDVEQRLSTIYDIARKHRVAPEQLTTLQQQLNEELAGLQSGDVQLEQLEEKILAAKKEYDELACELSKRRQRVAVKLQQAVNKKLRQLAMEQAQFTIALNTLENPSRNGNEQVAFLLCTNPGQAPKALAKIASGGELSRVSLAIQVVTAQTSAIATLVFDEVDVGISGETGDEVGRLLRQLGDNSQVICVTHLAQVASKAHKHLLVSKQMSKRSASSSIRYLEGEEKVAEIARMMGGASESQQSIAHAKEMLATSM